MNAMQQSQKGHKAGLGFIREEKKWGNKRAEREKAAESQLLSSFQKDAALLSAAYSRQGLDEMIAAGPAGAREKMQQSYANQMKNKIGTQLKQGFTSGGSIERELK